MNSKERLRKRPQQSGLTKLETKNDQIDTYIATFEHLLSKAGWEQAAHGTLEMFEQRSSETTALGHLATRPHPNRIRRLACRCTTRNRKEKTGPSKSEIPRRGFPQHSPKSPERNARTTIAAAVPKGPRCDGGRRGFRRRRESNGMAREKRGSE